MHNSTIIKASKDFFTSKFLFLSLAPFIVPIVVLGGFFIYGSTEFFTLLQQGSVNGDYSFIDEANYPVFSYLLSFAVFHWLIMTLFVVLGTFGVVLLSLVIAVITVGFLTPYIVDSVRKDSYPHVAKAKTEGFLSSLWTMFKIFMKFVLLFLCTLPFLLLPFVNFFIFQLPFFYLFYRLMMFDLVSSGVSRDAEHIIKENKLYLFVVMGLFFFLSLIPMFGLLLQVFFVVYLSHFILNKSQAFELSSNTSLEKQ
jgi:hypothetical protein